MKLDGVGLTADGIKLSGKEFQLMSLFLKHKGEILSKNAISQAVWGKAPQSNLLATLVCALKKKLSIDIFTVTGVGYIYK